MSWILPTRKATPAGRVRVVIRLSLDDEEDVQAQKVAALRAYQRAYYHAKRKGRKQPYTPEQQAKRRESRMAQYRANVERERANARARYWKHRDRYAAASRERQRALHSKPL